MINGIWSASQETRFWLSLEISADFNESVMTYIHCMQCKLLRISGHYYAKKLACIPRGNRRTTATFNIKMYKCLQYCNTFILQKCSSEPGYCTILCRVQVFSPADKSVGLYRSLMCVCIMCVCMYINIYITHWPISKKCLDRI